MTKRVFKHFADRLRADITETERRFSAEEAKRTRDAAMYAAHTFAAVAAEENPHFDYDRFMKACGLR